MYHFLTSSEVVLIDCCHCCSSLIEAKLLASLFHGSNFFRYIDFSGQISDDDDDDIQIGRSDAKKIKKSGSK